jgi:hypothetical protein
MRSQQSRLDSASRAAVSSPVEAGSRAPAASSRDARGAAEIADAANFDWETLWLKTAPPAEDPSTITQELGLGDERGISQGTSDMPATELSGTRHGRRVSLRIGVVPSTWRGRGVYEVHVEASVAALRARADDARLVAEPGALPEVEELFAALAPAPDVLRDLEVDGGSDGILSRRPVTAHAQGYVYDLWLVERLADRLGA